MDVITIRSATEFISIVSNKFFIHRKSDWVFRGQTNVKYDLISSVGRIKHTSATFEKFEMSLFNIFKRSSVGLIEKTPSSDYEWLTLAQHHGLPTRLIDFSTNPLVAAYFACCSNEDKDGVIFCLNADKKIPDSVIQKDSPFTLKQPGKLNPVIVTPRVSSQEGLFIILNNPEEPLTQKNLRWEMVKLIIPSELKRKVRYWLYRIGVSEATLFPDINGLCQKIKWQHTVDSSLMRAE